MTLLKQLFISVLVTEWQCCKKPNSTEKKISRRYHSVYKFINKIIFGWNTDFMAAATAKTVILLGTATVLPVAIYCSGRKGLGVS